MAEAALFTELDDDRLDVQDDAIKVEEGSGAQRNLVSIIAEKGRPYKGILADRSEPLYQ